MVAAFGSVMLPFAVIARAAADDVANVAALDVARYRLPFTERNVQWSAVVEPSDKAS